MIPAPNSSGDKQGSLRSERDKCSLPYYTEIIISHQQKDLNHTALPEQAQNLHYQHHLTDTATPCQLGTIKCASA
jgi:hypothetical protein